jgi:hypothetical protein
LDGAQPSIAGARVRASPSTTRLALIVRLSDMTAQDHHNLKEFIQSGFYWASAAKSYISINFSELRGLLY